MSRGLAALALLLSLTETTAAARAGEPPPPTVPAAKVDPPRPAPAPAGTKSDPTFAELQGDITVVSFWATWCPPCVAELPSVAALHAHVSGGTRVVAVSVQDGAGAADARQLFAARKLTIPLLTDGKPLYARLFPRAGSHVSVPRLAVIDRGGRGYELEGFAPDESAADFVRELDAVIARVHDGKARLPAGWRRLRR